MNNECENMLNIIYEDIEKLSRHTGIIIKCNFLRPFETIKSMISRLNEDEKLALKNHIANLLSEIKEEIINISDICDILEKEGE